MATVRAIGEPENRSEAKAIRHLAEVLPDGYFVLHNFEVTTGHGLPYEYDVVVIADFAALVAVANDAPDEALAGAGIKGNQLKALLRGRPFADAEALGSTAGVGKKTLRALDSLTTG